MNFSLRFVKFFNDEKRPTKEWCRQTLRIFAAYYMDLNDEFILEHWSTGNMRIKTYSN